MAKTLAYLRNQTRTYLDESTQADFTDAEVDREINNGYHKVVTAVFETYEDFYLATFRMDSVAGQQEYDSTDGLPDTLFKIRRIEINYNPSTTKRVVAKPVQLDEIPTDISNTNPNITAFHAPVWYLMGIGSGNERIGFIPVPTENITDAIKVWYVYQVEDLVLSADLVVIPYPDRYAQSISRYAAGVLMSKGQQEERVGLVYIESFEKDMRQMQQQLEDRRAQWVKTVVDTAGQDVDFSSAGLM